MVADQTTTVTVDRVSNSGNAIAKDKVQGKDVHAPVAEVGSTLEVKLTDKGSHFEATLVDRATENTPRQLTVGPNTSDLSKGRETTEDKHSFSVGKSITGDVTGQKFRSWASSRKL